MGSHCEGSVKSVGLLLDLAKASIKGSRQHTVEGFIVSDCLPLFSDYIHTHTPLERERAKIHNLFGWTSDLEVKLSTDHWTQAEAQCLEIDPSTLADSSLEVNPSALADSSLEVNPIALADSSLEVIPSALADSQPG
eukprot:g30133.t1